MEMTRLSDMRDAQPHAVDALSHALSGGRLHHAYLLAGAPETNADRLALAVAASLVCASRDGADACGECAGCRKNAAGNHPDVHRIMPNDKMAIPIDAVRYLEGRLSLAAAEAATKVAIIEQADLMAPPAQNALLKTLEEPPGATCFLLTTSRVRRLLATVRSRTQTLRLAPARRTGAWRQLVGDGIPEDLARPAAALVGPDVGRAQALIDAGLGDLVASLRAALGPNAGSIELLAAAAEIGSDKEQTELALSLIEVEVRDRLAGKHGVTGDKLYMGSRGLSTRRLPEDRLADVAARLARLRRLKVYNVNRTLAVESVLLALTGMSERRAAAGGSSV